MSCPYFLQLRLLLGGSRTAPTKCVLYQTSSVLRQIIWGRTFSRGKSAIMP